MVSCIERLWVTKLIRVLGWGLIKTQNGDMQTEGIKLLQGASSSPYSDLPIRRHCPRTDLDIQGGLSEPRADVPAPAEIYSASPPHRRECSYYIAVGYYKLKNFANAKKFNGACHPFSLSDQLGGL